MVLGPLISAGANIIGGLLNRESAKDANAANLRMAQENIALQKDFAQQGVRWKVADAKAAGIHPLYALGANTVSFSPVSAGQVADTSMGAALANAGQDISRAVDSTRTSPEKVAALKIAELQMEGAQLDNEIKRTQIASSVQRLKQASTPPTPSIGPVVPDSTVPFKHPEGTKPEERPPLMLWGGRVLTPPGTSPMKAWEDQIGDDGPVSWLAQLGVLTHMITHNFNQRFGLNLPSAMENSIDAKAYRSRQSRQFRQR